MKTPAGAARPQIAALPMRRDENGNVQILLITSRETQRWIIPKGWPMKGRTNSQAAAQEALEEAGVAGRVRKKPLGKYLYWKRTQANFELCEVSVYALEVKRQLETWREKDQRQARWFALEEAADRVEEPGLSAILRALQSKET
jgi:8-oxo-dGTP pyrophosphatase MutT (NUDIX family)